MITKYEDCYLDISAYTKMLIPVEKNKGF